MKTNIKCPHCEKKIVLSVEKEDVHHEAVTANVIANVSKDSNIASAMWENNEMIVMFSNDFNYKYFNVPKSEWLKFASTLKDEKQSSGTHFYKYIRNNYECEKLK